MHRAVTSVLIYHYYQVTASNAPTKRVTNAEKQQQSVEIRVPSRENRCAWQHIQHLRRCKISNYLLSNPSSYLSSSRTGFYSLPTAAESKQREPPLRLLT